MDSKTNKETAPMNILEIPEIKAAMEAERAATDPDTKRELHNQFLHLVKVEQVRRGQRTKMTYRTK